MLGNLKAVEEGIEGERIRERERRKESVQEGQVYRAITTRVKISIVLHHKPVDFMM